MTDRSHSPEPWKVDVGSLANDDGFIPLEGAFQEDAYDGDPTAEANAKRIVLCVNACVGLSEWEINRAITAWRMEADTVEDVLREAALQIQYLHEKFQETGTGNNVLAKIQHVLTKFKP